MHEKLSSIVNKNQMIPIKEHTTIVLSIFVAVNRRSDLPLGATDILFNGMNTSAKNAWPLFTNKMLGPVLCGHLCRNCLIECTVSQHGRMFNEQKICSGNPGFPLENLYKNLIQICRVVVPQSFDSSLLNTGAPTMEGPLLNTGANSVDSPALNTGAPSVDGPLLNTGAPSMDSPLLNTCAPSMVGAPLYILVPLPWIVLYLILVTLPWMDFC